MKSNFFSIILVLAAVLQSTQSDVDNNTFRATVPKNDDDNNYKKENSEWIDLPENYKQLSAASKAALLSNKIVASEYGQSVQYSQRPEWPNDLLHQVMNFSTVPAMALSFTCNEQNTDIYTLNRIRIFHKLGVAGMINFSMTPNLAANIYTGLLAAGSSSIGLVRLSHGLSPELVKTHGPGMAMKLFIDGQWSADTVSIFDMDGFLTNNTDFFHTLVRTSIPCPLSKNLKFVTDFFEKVEDPFTTFPLRQFARFTPAGILVENPSYPLMLNFVPHERLIDVIPKNSTNDFRDDLMQNVTLGPLYYVYAATGVEDVNPLKIGLMTLTSRLMESDFADNRLCFRHRRNKPEKHSSENDF